MSIRSEITGRLVKERVYTGLENMKVFLNKVTDSATEQIDRKQRLIIDEDITNNK